MHIKRCRKLMPHADSQTLSFLPWLNGDWKMKVLQQSCCVEPMHTWAFVVEAIWKNEHSVRMSCEKMWSRFLHNSRHKVYWHENTSEKYTTT